MSDAFWVALPAAIAALGAFIVGIRSSRKVDELRHTTNGMSKRLEEAEFRRGKREGVTGKRERRR